jgi:GR25 family glycosyltransferase involved in LPS biosynthesis
MFSTFLINLHNETKRYQHMKEQLDAAGILFEKIEAINGREYKPTESEYTDYNAIQKNGATLSQGELGCALSHRIAYQKALESNEEYSLILEDDTVLPNNFKDIIEREIQLNNKKWQYLAFNYMEPGFYFLRFWFRSIYINYCKQNSLYDKGRLLLLSFGKCMYIIPLAIYESIREILLRKSKNGKSVIFARPLYLAGAYVINKSAARKLLELSSPITYPADKIQNIARKQGLQHRAYCPLIVAQDRVEFGSNILGVTSHSEFT